MFLILITSAMIALLSICYVRTMAAQVINDSKTLDNTSLRALARSV